MALEKSPLLSEEVHGLCSRAEVSCARLRQAMGCSDLPSGCAGLGQMLEHAMAIRRAVSVCSAFFTVRRASEIAGLLTPDASVDEAVGAAELIVRRHKNDQLGAGQRARVVATSSWRGACPVQLTSGWFWSRAWLARRRDYAGRMSSSPEGGPLFVELARAPFGLGAAPSGVSAA